MDRDRRLRDFIPVALKNENVRSFLVPIVGGALLLIVLVVHWVNAERNQAARASLSTALAPAVDALRSQLVRHPSVGEGKLSRPYLFFYLGDIDGGDGASDFRQFDGSPVKGVMPTQSSSIGVGDIRTLIVLEDQHLEDRTYKTTTEGVPSGSPHTYHRYRYYLWAFDMASGTLDAYTSMDDEGFLESYTDSGPHTIGYQELRRWADSVTVSP